MARVAVPVTELALNGATAPSLTTADATNGHVVDVNGETRTLVLYAKNTAASAQDLTVLAGDDPPAVRAGLGNLVVSVPSGGERFLTLESARFVQSDGTILIDLASGFTGSLAAYRLPEGL